MKIFNLKRKNSSCDYHRIELPFKHINDLDYVDNYEKCDIYIFNRFPHLDNETFLKEKKRLGFKYIIDLDDYWLLDKVHYLSENFRKAKIFEKTLELIKNADFVTVTTERLFLLCRLHNKNVEIVPNALPYDVEQFTLKNVTKMDKNISFGYSGGLSHLQDINILSNDKKLITLDLDFSYLGYEINDLNSEMMKNAFPFKKVKTEQKKCLETYMTLYDNIDVSLVPLNDTFFNKCKSNLKTLEAGAKGLCMLASKITPYYNKTDKKQVIYVDNKFDWYKKINYLIRNPNFVFDKGQALATHVRKHYNLFDINVSRVEIIYRVFYGQN